MAKRSVEQWLELATFVALDVLEQEGAFGARELEAKAADAPWGDADSINPHHLTKAVSQLRAQGGIELQTNTTRGGGMHNVYTLSPPTKRANRAAGRKRILLARYSSWTTAGRDWNPSPIGAALERVVHASLLEAAPYGYQLVEPTGAEVKELFGVRVPGGPLDNAAWHTRVGLDGTPTTTLVLIEAKNLREWVYPRTQELYQLLDKAVSLSVAHPNVGIIPVLVCRRSHYTTTQMAKQIGLHVIETKTQYVRPVILGIDDGQRKLDEVNAELGYDIEPHETAVQQMTRQFRVTLPNRIDEASERWGYVAAHPDVPDIVALLRDEEVGGQDRTRARDTFARFVSEALSEATPWASAEHE